MTSQVQTNRPPVQTTQTQQAGAGTPQQRPSPLLLPLPAPGNMNAAQYRDYFGKLDAYARANPQEVDAVAFLRQDAIEKAKRDGVDVSAFDGV